MKRRDGAPMDPLAKPSREELDLSQLGGGPMDAILEDMCHGAKERVAAIEAEMEEYRRKYGKDWMDKWLADKDPLPDYDRDLKSINKSIYDGCPLFFMGASGIREAYDKMEAQMREVYGDAMDRLRYHAPADPEAVELLIQWAGRTGRWKELPDVLQPVYRERYGGGGLE